MTSGSKFSHLGQRTKRTLAVSDIYLSLSLKISCNLQQQPPSISSMQNAGNGELLLKDWILERNGNRAWKIFCWEFWKRENRHGLEKETERKERIMMKDANFKEELQKIIEGGESIILLNTESRNSFHFSEILRKNLRFLQHHEWKASMNWLCFGFILAGCVCRESEREKLLTL